MKLENGKYYTINGNSIVEYICEDEKYHYATICYVLDSIHLSTGKRNWRKPEIDLKVTKINKDNIKDKRIKEIGTKKDLFIELI